MVVNLEWRDGWIFTFEFFVFGDHKPTALFRAIAEGHLYRAHKHRGFNSSGTDVVLSTLIAKTYLKLPTVYLSDEFSDLKLEGYVTEERARSGIYYYNKKI